MPFPFEELMKFGVAGGLILFTIIRLFSYLEKRETARAEGDSSSILFADTQKYIAAQTVAVQELTKQIGASGGQALVTELSEILARHAAILENLSRQISEHADESRQNFRRIEDKVDTIRK